VNQFDRGAALITTEEEREQVAELNLRAASVPAAAACTALRYFATGRALPENGWERCYHSPSTSAQLGRERVSDRELALAEERTLGTVTTRSDHR
jgi:hypothetical protein